MEFRILGPLEVIGDAGPISLGGPQQRRVLAVLLSDPGRILTYDRLVEVLWPDTDEPHNARRSAITYVSRLRAAVGEGVVQTTDAGYVVDAGAVSVDADRFVALLDHARTMPADRAVDVLDEALGLWRGAVFGDLNAEWWARPMVKKLEELRLTALGERIDAMTANGWDGRSIAEATSLIDAHPLREQFVDKAMRGLHAVGQTADALRVFNRYRSELADQTGLDPSPALCELESSMATGAVLEPSSAGIARPLRGYVLRELLGEGSFGAVYRATQPGVERDVAVKVIRPELADDRSFVRRFEAEAQLVARLEHPHIVPLYDFWRQPGGAFLVFRLMRGGSAEALVTSNGPLTLERAGAVLADIGSALTAAHGQNVVHRDVKPANILFDDAGVAYLADFGIAAALGTDSKVPQRWSAGSALYASPEQLRDGVEDAQADQYALAVTIWELLTGRAPFGGRDASSVMATKLRESLGPVEEFCPSVPAAISAVLSRAGSVHPMDRYASVAEFVGAWQRAFAGVIAGDTNPASIANGDVVLRSGAATMLGAGRPVSNPYKGLRPFREADVADFHGRASLVDRLVATVADASFVAVVGPSGSGKSSVVLAGLVPRLRVSGCLVVTMTPGENPLASSSVALSQLASEGDVDLLSMAAMRRPTGMRDAMKAISNGDDLVVVIDQLEELWTLASEEERDRFLSSLADPIAAGFCRVVATIRADFFDRPLADATLGPLVSKHTFGVTPMTAAELHEAITRPADQVGVRFEPALVSQLVAETIDQPGSLPLLQFTLGELFEGRNGAVITTDAYNELGGLAGSLSRQAEDIYDGFGAADRGAVRRMFSRLVAPGEGSEDTRRRVTVGELAGVPDHVVAAFVNRRLVTSDRDRVTREPIVEVAHEVLLRSWPRLRGWLAEDRTWLRELRGLSAAAAQWDAGGNDEGDLYRGARLAVVAELASAHPDALTEPEQRFLARSLDQGAAQEREAQRRLVEKTRQNRRLRRSLVGIGVVLVVALAAGVVAIVQRERADRQQHIAVEQRGLAVQQQQIADSQRTEAEKQKTIAQGEKASADDAASKAQLSATQAEQAKTASELTTLASRSLAARTSQRDVAALLAVEAWKRSPDATSKSALFGTFTSDPGFLGYLRFDGASGVQGVAVPGTTHMLITPLDRSGSGLSKPRVIDVVTGQTVVALDSLTDQPVADAQFAVSPNGRFGAVSVAHLYGGPGVAAVFDLATGHMVGPIIHFAGLIHQLAVDATGARLAAGADDAGAAQVFDVASGQIVATIPSIAGVTYSQGDTYESGGLAYGPDGDLYVGSPGDKLRIFDPASLAMKAQISVPLHSTAGLLRFGADGSTLVAQGVYVDPATGLQNGSIVRIDLIQRRTLWDISGADYGFGECTAFAFSVSADRLWCSNFFGSIRERSLRTGARTGRVLQNQKGWATNLEVVSVPDGIMLAAVGNNDGVIGRWRVDGGGPIQQLVAAGHFIQGVLPDGNTLLVAAPSGQAPPLDRTYTLWDIATDRALPGLPDFVFAVASGDVVFGVRRDLTVATYDVRSGTQRSLPISLPPVPKTFSVSDDASALVLGYDDGHAVAYDARSGAQLQSVQVPAATVDSSQAVGWAVINHDHSRIYVAAAKLYAFDVATGREFAHFDDNAIEHVEVSSANVVVGSSLDGTLGLYDPDTLAKVGTLPGARGFVQNAYFSSDGSTLVAGGNDGSVSIYDVASRTRLGDAIEEDRNTGTYTALRADAGMVALETPSDNGIELWSLDPAAWVKAACAIAGRNLTTEEWTTYIGDLGEYRATCPEYPGAAN